MIKNQIGDIVEFEFERFIEGFPVGERRLECETEVSHVKQSGYDDIQIFQKLDEISVNFSFNETEVLKRISVQLITLYETMKNSLVKNKL